MFYNFFLTILSFISLVAATTHSDYHDVLERASRLVARQGQQSCLDPDLIQSASAKTGQEPGTEGIKPGQAPSATDANNFINFCKGQQITNGVQVKSGSCNPIPMGRIPATSNMISAMITSPQAGETLTAGTTFNVQVQTSHLRAGNFVNPTTNYYTAPQDLDQNGDIIGHCHVTIQDIGSLKSTTPPDPSRFVFFKGIDDDGNGQGLLQAVVEGGLPAGVYRVCTMIAAQNHQPVTMPVAQRGAQDDCTKFEVVDGQGSSGGGGGGGASASEGQQNASPTSLAPAATSKAARFGKGRGREPKENPVEKRRAQLRRAQQSYRSRKDKYTRTLEEELAGSRSKEVELMRECEQLRENLQNALHQLSQLGVNVPAEIKSKASENPYNEYASPSTTTGLSTSVSPIYLDDCGSQTVDIIPSPQLISPESFSDFYSPSEGQRGPILFNTGGGLGNNSRVSEVDQIIVGMEFVLKIEEPCLGHLHGDVKKPHEPGNHALTASAQLMASCDYPSPTNRCTPLMSPTFGNTPTAMLERLLTLAPDLSDEGEMTPVQAWNNIRCRPNFGGLNARSLGLLAERLKKAVKCHGFGAVVKQSVFDSLVYETLLVGQTF
ncbi:hypothetical protein CEP53_006550 [Fusarium sp. AF-6]|nr:hypothetical protein CEP53_006550 [Fusarium sp. AF-6]